MITLMSQSIVITPLILSCFMIVMQNSYNWVWHRYYQISVNYKDKQEIRFSNRVHDVSLDDKGVIGHLRASSSEHMNMLININSWWFNSYDTMRLWFYADFLTSWIFLQEHSIFTGENWRRERVDLVDNNVQITWHAHKMYLQ